MGAGVDRWSPTTENYLKAVLALAERLQGDVTVSALAERLDVLPSTVSGKLRSLGELGLVEHRPYRGVTLTELGTATALGVVRRHRLIETYLVSELGYGWDEVHDEAEVLEHHVSDTFVARVDARLGHPRFDPHGDPIPAADGTMAPMPSRRLATLTQGERARLVRVDDADPAMLRHLSADAIALGDVCELVERRPFHGPFVIRCHRRGARCAEAAAVTTHELGPALAEAMWVEVPSLG